MYQINQFVHFFSISGELKKLVRSEIEYPIDLLDVLETRGFLDKNNLLYLQSILHHIDKPDLFNTVVEYAAKTLDDVVHFQKPPDNPGRGFKWKTIRCTNVVGLCVKVLSKYIGEKTSCTYTFGLFYSIHLLHTSVFGRL